jgi:frataxin-like iron-binding protein CyaY
MAKIPVHSSHIAAIEYRTDGVTELAFRNGKQYVINGLPPEVFEQWVLAESKGSFFATKIKPYYDVQKKGIGPAALPPASDTPHQPSH